MLRAEVRLVVRRTRPQAQQVLILEKRIHRTQAEAQKHTPGKGPASLARDQHIRAGRALRVGQRAMLFDNQLPPERNHKQQPKPAAQQRQDKDPCILEVKAQKDQRRQRKDHPCRNRLPRIARRLDNIVLKDRSPAQRPQHRDRQHRDRDGSTHRQPGTQAHIHSHRPKQQPKEAAEQQRPRRQLRPVLLRGKKRLEIPRRNRPRGTHGRWATLPAILLANLSTGDRMRKSAA